MVELLFLWLTSEVYLCDYFKQMSRFRFSFFKVKNNSAGVNLKKKKSLNLEKKIPKVLFSNFKIQFPSFRFY